MPTDSISTCPACGQAVLRYRNPIPTVDVVIELTDQGDPPPIVLVERANQPLGWALPGGFVEYGETLENTAVREALEETGLAVELVGLLGAYSDPARDRRQHTLSVVYVGRAVGQPVGGDDAASARAFPARGLPGQLCFDHGKMVEDYLNWREGRGSLAPLQK